MGKQLKKARIDLEMKAMDVARECCISNTYYSQLENDKALNPSKKLMIKISRVLKKSVAELFLSE